MKNPNISIIGLGYVGLPLALNFSNKKFKTFGIDNDADKINKLKNNLSYLTSVSDKEIKTINKKKIITFTTDYSVIKESKFIIICLPTPLKNNSPDLSYLKKSIIKISKFLKKKQTIILESTSYPGTTSLLAKNLSKRSKLILDKDFYFGFSPERENPGGTVKYDKIPKVISSTSVKGLKVINELYTKVFNTVVISKSTEEAEAAKLLENCFRSVNIALINELRDLFNKTNLDIWEIIKVAKTKPFGFMPFYPSVGAGGHCIPIDPVYLSWYAKKNKANTTLLDYSIKFNDSTPFKVSKKIIKEIKNKKLINKKIIVFGITYKKNVNDIRESASLKIFKYLLREFDNVSYYDENIKYTKIENKNIYSLTNDKLKITKDIISIIAVDHRDVNYSQILKKSFLIFDCVNKFKINKKIISI